MPPINIAQVFSAEAKSVFEFLADNGQAFYIPAYQRPYAWDNSDIGRLIEDAVNGLEQLQTEPESLRFLGSVIAIHDTENQTISPIFKREVPNKVMTVIDGQQRLSTLVMLNITLHEHLRKQLHLFREETDAITWLKGHIDDEMIELRKTFELDRNKGDEHFRYYPRIIRAFDDAWSRSSKDAKYTSPIASFIHGYTNHHRGRSTKVYKFDPKDIAGNRLASCQTLRSAHREIQQQIKRLVEDNHAELNLPHIQFLIDHVTYRELIWRDDFLDAAAEFFRENTQSPDYGLACQAVRTVSLCRYVNHRLAFAVVETKGEDYAFDMFEALNTTGQPLTAIETFKPRVVDAEGLAEYETSESYEYMRALERRLEHFSNADQRQKAATSILIPFALAENGEKLAAHLTAQRRYLSKCYAELEQLENRRSFVRNLSELSCFMERYWEEKEGDAPIVDAIGDDAVAKFCLLALKDLNHTIVLAPLARFYSTYLAAPDEAKGRAGKNLVGAIKASTAFSMLWRASRIGTENIDNHYREIMREGVPTLDNPPLCRRPRTGNAPSPSLARFKSSLRWILGKKGAVDSAESWVKAVSRIASYRTKKVARFILLSASHDSCPMAGDGTEGLLEAGTKGVSEFMHPDRWKDERLLTIEHIAPQSKNGAWNKDLYDDPDIVHKLGNLILLPADVNSLMAARPWKEKQLYYRLLSAETKKAQEVLLAEARQIGLTVSRKGEDLMKDAGYLTMCGSVGAVAGDWTRDVVDRRTRNLAELAWAKIHPWLTEDS